MVIFHQMVVSNETISEDMAFSFRNIEGHKHIDKRCTLYSIWGVWFWIFKIFGIRISRRIVN